MKDLKLLISFDGRLSTVTVRALDVPTAMTIIRNQNPDRTAMLVTQL